MSLTGELKSVYLSTDHSVINQHVIYPVIRMVNFCWTTR